jgi:hypothetical protein
MSFTLTPTAMVTLLMTMGVIAAASLRHAEAQGNASPKGEVSLASSVVSPGAELKLVVGDCKFTEGPASDAQGNVYLPTNLMIGSCASGSMAQSTIS